MKILDVGAGFFRYPGAETIDGNAAAKPDILHDLNIFPWPVADNSYDVVYSSHCLEHLDNAKKAVEEMWRIARPGAEIIIKVPHFSSRVAWTDLEHVRGFGIHVLRRFMPAWRQIADTPATLDVEKVILRWQQRIDDDFVPGRLKVLLPFVRAANAVITGLANLSVEFCERIWCYYVGGMGEVEFHARAIKE